MRRKPYDGRFGTWAYRAGRAAGCYNIFKDDKYYISVINSVLSKLIRMSGEGVRISRKILRQTKRQDYDAIMASLRLQGREMRCRASSR